MASPKPASDSEVAKAFRRVQRTDVTDVWLLRLEEGIQVVRKLTNLLRASISAGTIDQRPAKLLVQRLAEDRTVFVLADALGFLALRLTIGVSVWLIGTVIVLNFYFSWNFKSKK